MRALFLLLLIANLVMFAWIMNDAPTTDAAPPALTRPGIDTIVLLAEADAGAAGGAAAQPASPAPSGESAAQASAAPATTAAAEAVPAAGTPTAAEATAAAAPVAEPAPEPETEPAPAPPAERCYTVGPFRDLDELRALIKAIRDEVIEASFRSSEEREQSLFWVYLAPEADMASARAMTRMLTQKNIKDFYIIREGDKLHGISLGHFSEQSRAQRHRDRLRKLGFSPQIEPVFRNYTIYWLDYRLAAGRDIDKLLDARGLDGSVSHFDRDCG